MQIVWLGLVIAAWFARRRHGIGRGLGLAALGALLGALTGLFCGYFAVLGVSIGSGYLAPTPEAWGPTPWYATILTACLGSGSQYVYFIPASAVGCVAAGWSLAGALLLTHILPVGVLPSTGILSDWRLVGAALRPSTACPNCGGLSRTEDRNCIRCNAELAAHNPEASPLVTSPSGLLRVALGIVAGVLIAVPLSPLAYSAPGPFTAGLFGPGAMPAHGQLDELANAFLGMGILIGWASGLRITGFLWVFVLFALGGLLGITAVGGLFSLPQLLGHMRTGVFAASVGAVIFLLFYAWEHRPQFNSLVTLTFTFGGVAGARPPERPSESPLRETGVAAERHCEREDASSSTAARTKAQTCSDAAGNAADPIHCSIPPVTHDPQIQAWTSAPVETQDGSSVTGSLSARRLSERSALLEAWHPSEEAKTWVRAVLAHRGRVGRWWPLLAGLIPALAVLALATGRRTVARDPNPPVEQHAGTMVGDVEDVWGGSRLKRLSTTIGIFIVPIDGASAPGMAQGTPVTFQRFSSKRYTSGSFLRFGTDQGLWSCAQLQATEDAGTIENVTNDLPAGVSYVHTTTGTFVVAGTVVVRTGNPATVETYPSRERLMAEGYVDIPTDYPPGGQFLRIVHGSVGLEPPEGVLGLRPETTAMLRGAQPIDQPILRIADKRETSDAHGKDPAARPLLSLGGSGTTASIVGDDRVEALQIIHEAHLRESSSAEFMLDHRARRAKLEKSVGRTSPALDRAYLGYPYADRIAAYRRFQADGEAAARRALQLHVPEPRRSLLVSYLRAAAKAEEMVARALVEEELRGYVAAEPQWDDEREYAAHTVAPLASRIDAAFR